MNTPTRPKGFRLLSSEERKDTREFEKLVAWSEHQKEWQPSLGIGPDMFCAVPCKIQMTLSDLTSKTPEELNVICAELLGWTDVRHDPTWRDGRPLSGHIGDRGLRQAVPNYTGSWDAIMPEVRKLKGKQADTFIDFLMALTDGGTGPAFCVMFRIMSATPDQLTIALILTLHP